MMFPTPAPEPAAPNEMPSNNPPVEPGSQNDDKRSRPGLAGRSHLENQERAYVAASRRSDRTLDARYLSAQMASKIHKDRTGKAFKLSMEIVEHEEMYEEEDGEMSSMKLLDSEAKTAKSQLSEKLDSWIHGKNTVMNLIANSEPRERYDVVNQIFSHTYPSMASGSTGHGQPFDPRPPMAAQMMHGSQSQHGIQAQQGVQGQQGIGDTLDFQSRYRMMQSARAMEAQQFGRDSRPAAQRDGPPAARPSSSSPPKSASLQRPGIFRADSTPNLGLSNPASPPGPLNDAAYLDSNTGSTASSYHSTFSGIGMDQNFSFGVRTGAVTPGTPMNFVSGADTFTGALPYSTATLVNSGGLPADLQGSLSGRPIGTAGPAMSVQPSQGGFLEGTPHLETGQQQHSSRMPSYGTQQAQYRQRVSGPVPGQGPVLHPQHPQGQGPTHGLQQCSVLAPQDWAQFFDRQVQSSQQLQQQQRIHEGLERGYVDRRLNQFLISEKEKDLRQRRQQMQQQQVQQVIEAAQERQQQINLQSLLPPKPQQPQQNPQSQQPQQNPQSQQPQQDPSRQDMEMVIQRLHQQQQRQLQLNLEKKLERRAARQKVRQQKEQHEQELKEQHQQQQKEPEQEQQHQMELDEEQLPQDQAQQDKPKRRKTRAPRLQPQQSPQQKSRVQKPKSQKSKPTQQKLKLPQQHQVLQIQEQMQQTLRIMEQQNEPQQQQQQEELEEQPQEQSQLPQRMQSPEPQEQQQAQPHLQPEQPRGLSQLWAVDEILDSKHENMDECEDELEKCNKFAEPESPSGGPSGGESAEQAVPSLEDVAWSMFINETLFNKDDC